MSAGHNLPTGWTDHTLGELFDFSNGVNADKSAYGTGVPFANVLEIVAHEALTEALTPGRIALSPAATSRYSVLRGDLLFNRTSETPDEVGLASVYLGDTPIAFGGFVFRGRPKTDRLTVAYSQYALRAHSVREQIVARGQGAIRANIGQRDLKLVRIQLPPRDEQLAIAAALSTADELMASLQRLLAKQHRMHEGLSQSLLTGASRLPGFDQPWQSYAMGEVLAPRTERNVSGEQLEVLSCTKHRGFVRSLDYFTTRVYSRDLSSYLVIHRGDIGYPANHVEEGSIGVQELVRRGLVSPIYVVMKPRDGVDSYFLQRRLKLSSFRHELARSTNASVNRRGSLRWKEFSRLSTALPSNPAEQRALLASMWSELAAAWRA
jgi:type I restriction enzyme S subunit